MISLDDMESGECRWIIRHDVHVYCRRPMQRRDGGGWMPGEATYAVACPDAGMDGEEWMSADEALDTVYRITRGVRAAG